MYATHILDWVTYVHALLSSELSLKLKQAKLPPPLLYSRWHVYHTALTCHVSWCVQVVRNVLTVDYHMSRYKTVVEELQREIAELKTRLAQQGPL